MKKIYSLYLLIGCFFLTMGARLNAQTYVEINYSYAYLNNTCVVPANGYFYASVITLNYTISDSVDIFVDFGDGNDTTFRVVQAFSNPFAYSSTPSLAHTYTAQGIYPVTYIATLPDGNADTVLTAIMVTSTCNNVTGRVYQDVDASCSYNTGDAALSSYWVGLEYNGLTVASTYTNASGQYTLNALPGYTYNLVTGNYNSPPLSYSCSTSQGMTITPSPNATQDLITDNNTVVYIAYAGDSASFNSGNCVPYTSNIYLSGNTLGYSAPNDSVHMYINFGDGSDTTYTAPVSGPMGYFSMYVNHTYTSAGNFDVLYVATGTDGSYDSLIHYNEVSIQDTCGNVEGNVYLDNNSNCILDTGDSTNVYVWVSLTATPSGMTYYAFTDAAGHYEFSVPPGNYTISILSSLNYFQLTPSCPSSGTATVTVTASNTVQSDFAVTCPSSHDLSGYFGITHGIFPTSNGHIYPYIYNLSCSPIAGSVTFILDPQVNYVGVCDPNFAPTVNGDTLTWTFANANAYLNWYFWYNYQGCITIIGDPSLQVGDSVCFTMIVNPIAGDMNPANNTYIRCVPALVPFDPNAKGVLPEGSGPQGYVPQNTTFDYRIEFQNTGTTAARDIFILDSLDSDLDLSTLTITGSSHLMQPQFLPGNVLKFKFDDIWLPDSASNEAMSHGWVTYRVTAKSALPNMTQIQNTAGIYFDFNAPIMTNSTLNTIFDPSSVNEINSNEASIFPNPASSTVQIVLSKESNAVYTLTDLAGKVVLTGKMQGRSATINVNELPQGVYLLNVSTTEGSSVHKVMVQH